MTGIQESLGNGGNNDHIGHKLHTGGWFVAIHFNHGYGWYVDNCSIIGLEYYVHVGVKDWKI